MRYRHTDTSSLWDSLILYQPDDVCPPTCLTVSLTSSSSLSIHWKLGSTASVSMRTPPANSVQLFLWSAGVWSARGHWVCGSPDYLSFTSLSLSTFLSVCHLSIFVSVCLTICLCNRLVSVEPKPHINTTETWWSSVKQTVCPAQLLGRSL